MEPAKYKVLVINDELPHLALVGAKLSNEGFAVYHAGNGKEAKEQFERGKHDILIVDTKLNGVHGPDLATELYRSVPKEARPYVVGISVDEDSRDLWVGFHDFQETLYFDARKVAEGFSANRRERDQGSSTQSIPKLA